MKEQVLVKALANDNEMPVTVIEEQAYVSVAWLSDYYGFDVRHGVRDLATVIAHDPVYKEKFNISAKRGIRVLADLIDFFQVDGVVCKKDVSNNGGRKNRFGYRVSDCLINVRWAHLFIMYHDFGKAIEVYDALVAVTKELQEIKEGSERILKLRSDAVYAMDNGDYEKAMHLSAEAARISAQNGHAAGVALAKRKKERKLIKESLEAVAKAAQIELF
ncbi:hypothetical protein ACKAXJ_000887 [Escherichia coli]